MVILQTMGWFLENPNHGYFYNQHSHRLVHTCRKSPSLNWSYNNTTRWKANKVAPITLISYYGIWNKLLYEWFILLWFSRYNSDRNLYVSGDNLRKKNFISLTDMGWSARFRCPGPVGTTFYDFFNAVSVKWSYIKKANFCAKMPQFVLRNSVWNIGLNDHS